MKKVFGVALVCLLLASFILAQEADTTSTPSPGSDQVLVNEDQAEALQQKIDEVLPFDEQGDFTDKPFKPFISKSEQHIESINMWLDENVGWLKFIFFMAPSITLLFGLNLFFITLFFYFFIFRSKGIFFFSKRPHLIGLFAFIAFGVARLYSSLAKLVHSWWVYAWTVVLPASIIYGILLLIAIIIVLIVAFPAVGELFSLIERYLQAKKEFKQTMDVSTQQMVSEAVGKQMASK